MTDLQALKFERDEWARLVATMPDGQVYVGVEPVRCFPLSDPQKSIALVDSDSHELLTIPSLERLNPDARAFLIKELESRDFVPEIQRVIATTNPNPPCEWTVMTDRGQTRFQLESEDDVRKLGQNRVMIADSNGVRYTITDVKKLDAASWRIVQRVF